jgi:MSHA biogenesis protein MshJ
LNALTIMVRQRWQRLSARIDALSPRERVLSFGAVAALLVFVGQALVIGPLAHRQDVLQAQNTQQRAALAAVNDDIVKKLADYGQDPNAALRERLGAVRQDTRRMQDELRTMEKGLVPAERIAPLLESMLRANGRLKLVSLRTLPADTIDGVTDAATRAVAQPAGPGALQAAVLQAAAPPADGAKPLPVAGTVLYRHGVELTVRGSYLDMVDYMSMLEGLPSQLFWGRAQLEAETYPSSRLTLTLYTLSLDPKWMKL